MERFHYPASNDDFDDACDLDALLHPSQAFEHPSEVVKDPDLTLNEKRSDDGKRRPAMEHAGRAL